MMTKTTTSPTPVRSRPLSPHIQIYRWPITMAMSIAHRVSGGALYFGTLFLAAWLIAIASGEEAFNFVNALFNSAVGRTLLFLYTAGLVHHLVGGVRHLFWDSRPALLDKQLATKTAWVTIAISLSVTLSIWLAGYALR